MVFVFLFESKKKIKKKISASENIETLRVS